MFLNFKRTLMNEVDSGSGNGAAIPKATESEIVPQAQGDTVTISKADLAALIAEETTKAIATVKDSIYAEARRTFTDSKKAKTAPAKSDDNPQTPTAAAPLSATEERAFLRGLDRYIATKGFKPSAAQYERAERALLSERPDSVDSWAADYFDGFGVVQPTTQPAQTQAAAPAPKPATEHPISNRGTPPPTQTPLEELDLWTATESDRQAFIRAKGIKAYVALLQEQGRNRPVRLQ